MKKQNNSLFVNINRETLNRLTNVVDETLAIDAINVKRLFTPEELWQIQRQRRTVSARRVFF